MNILRLAIVGGFFAAALFLPTTVVVAQTDQKKEEQKDQKAPPTKEEPRPAPAAVQPPPPAKGPPPVAAPAAAPVPAPTAAPAPANAGDARQAASELVALTAAALIADTTAKTVQQSWPPIEAALREKYPKLDPNTVNELKRELERLTASSLEAVMKDAPELYARNFSAQEIRDVLAFYRTPTGAKLLKAMPQVTGELSGLLAKRLQSIDEKINLAFLTILNKRGYYGN
jgi:uncharacterized protein